MLYYFFGVNLLQKLLYIIKKYLNFIFFGLLIYLYYFVSTAQKYIIIYIWFSIYIVLKMFILKKFY